MTWAKLFEEEAYRMVSYSKLAASGITVSTIWMGLERPIDFIGGRQSQRPLIFETRIFDFDGHSIDEFRYATEEEAKREHTVHVSRLSRRWADAKKIARGTLP